MARKLSDLEVVPARATARLCLDGALHDRVQGLVDRMQAAAREPDSEAFRAAAEAVEAERERAEAATQLFVFERMPAESWSDLLAQHENEHAKGPVDAFLDSIRPAVVRASMVDPEPDDSFGGFWAKLNHGQQQTLHDTAWGVNADPVTVPFVQAASLLVRALKRSSTTAASGASPDPSSSGGGSPSGPATSTTTPAGSSAA